MQTWRRAVLFALLCLVFLAAAWRTEGINSTMAFIAGTVFGLAVVAAGVRALVLRARISSGPGSLR